MSDHEFIGGNTVINEGNFPWDTLMEMRPNFAEINAELEAEDARLEEEAVSRGNEAADRVSAMKESDGFSRNNEKRDEGIAARKEYFEREAEKEGKLLVYNIPRNISERYDFLRDLPRDVVVMGGLARSVAREIVIGEYESVRDIDLVQMTDINWKGENPIGYTLDEPTDSETIKQLSAKYMPDDYSYGYGIKSDTLEKYMTTRDITINQCLIIDNKLILKEQAYDDFQENILRPTSYGVKKHNDELSYRIMLKMLLMQATLKCETTSAPTIEHCFKAPSFVSDFSACVFLNKAIGRGIRVAEEFVRNMSEWGYSTRELLGRDVREIVKKDLEEHSWGCGFYLGDNFSIEKVERELYEEVFRSKKWNSDAISDSELRESISAFVRDIFDGSDYIDKNFLYDRSMDFSAYFDGICTPDPLRLAEYLRNKTKPSDQTSDIKPFDFHPNQDARVADESMDYYADMRGMSDYYSSDTAIMRALGEYDDDAPAGKFYGHYPPEAYKRINSGEEFSKDDPDNDTYEDVENDNYDDDDSDGDDGYGDDDEYGGGDYDDDGDDDDYEEVS